MEVNEDDPEDIKRATPIENEIKKGEKDDTFERYSRAEKRRQKYQHCDKIAAKKSVSTKDKDKDCCETKREKAAKKKEAESKKTTVMVYEKPCVLPKQEIVPRQNLSKQEYIEILATPSRKCSSPCGKKAVMRKLRPVSERIKELALPTRKRMMITLQEGASKLSPVLLDNLIKTIEGESSLTPEQAADAFRAKKSAKKRAKKRKREESTKGYHQDAEETRRKFSRKFRSSDLQRADSSGMDVEAVTRQYLMAERFVKSILETKCPIPREEFSDIAEVVLRRLSEVLEYTPLEDEDRKSQQMRFLADLVACWIAGVLLEVAEGHKQAIEEECERKRQEMEEETDSEDEEEEKVEGNELELE